MNKFYQRPFSLRQSVQVLLPGQNIFLHILPNRVVIYSWENKKYIELGLLYLSSMDIVEKFSVFQDIGKKEVVVQGISQGDFFRYSLFCKDGILFINIKKGMFLKDKVILKFNDKKQKIGFEINSPVELISPLFYTEKMNALEQLHFGVFKKQNIENIFLRNDLREIFPFWFSLGQMYPKNDNDQILIQNIKKSIENRSKESIHLFKRLFYLTFEELFSPSMRYSEKHELSVVNILSAGFTLIRMFFIQQNDFEISILPFLPPQFHCGHLINAQLENIGKIDIRWTKKQVFILEIRAENNCKILLKLPSQVTSYRLRSSKKDKGNSFSNYSFLQFEEGKTYYFDRLMK